MSSKPYQSISPIRMLQSNHKQYQTPAKYLYSKNQTIHEQQHYKQKSQKLEKQNQQLRQEVRILEIQNRQMKTQIQIYRESSSNVKGYFNIEGIREERKGNQIVNEQKNNKHTIYPSETQQSQKIQNLLKQIRILKNNHEMQLTTYKDSNKKLSKQLSQLQSQISTNQQHNLSKNQYLKQNDRVRQLQEKNQKMESELIKMKMSVVEYMDQRDQRDQKVERLNKEVERLNKEVEELRIKENQFIEERIRLMEKVYKNKQSRYDQRQQTQTNDNRQYQAQIQVNQTKFSHINISPNKQPFNVRQSLYRSYTKNPATQIPNPISESHFSIHTFNGTKHVPAQQAFQITQSLHNQIHRLQAELQQQSISHTDKIHNLNYTLQRFKKQLQQKQNDLVNVLIKVKPLLLEKHRLTNKQNINNREADEKKNTGSQNEIQSFGKNAYGLKMLQIFLKKYKIQAF